MRWKLHKALRIASNPVFAWYIMVLLDLCFGEYMIHNLLIIIKTR